MSRARATAVLSALLVAIGVALLAKTVVVGGSLGYLLGALFVVAGSLRLYLALSRR